MTTYASLAEVKDYLGITDNSKDALLNIYLDSAERVINGFFSVDTMLSTDYTERLKIDSTSPSDQRGYEFFLRKRPVTAIKSINGITYTGVAETDYIIENQRKVTFKEISTYLVGFWWDSIKIVYTAGFATVPADIKLAEMMIVGQMYATGGSNNAYSSYAIGDEKVVFKSKEESQAVLNLLKPYKTFA